MSKQELIKKIAILKSLIVAVKALLSRVKAYDDLSRTLESCLTSLNNKLQKAKQTLTDKLQQDTDRAKNNPLFDVDFSEFYSLSR